MHEHVERPDRLGGPVDERGGGVEVGEVGRERHVAVAGQGGEEGVEPLGPAAGDGEGGASGGERLGGRPADAGRRTGEEHARAGDGEGHGPVSS